MADDEEIRGLYRALLECWNRQDACGFAALFAPLGNCVGFDGSQLDGRVAIEATLRDIFASHPTPLYVSKIREVRFLSPEVSVLRAVAGMIPRGASDIDPAVNAVQTMVARRDAQWQIEMFQNTPAAFHGRPEATEALSRELGEVLRATRVPN